MAGKGGVRPNSGRKSKDEENRIKDLMQPYSIDAIQCLANIIIDSTARQSDKISAAKLIIEYTYGKPKETVHNQHEIIDFDIKNYLKFGNSK